MPKFLCLAMIASVVLSVGSDAYAQRQGQTNQERISAAGTVQGFSGGLLYVMTKEGDQYRVKPPASPEYLTYVGSATPEFLRRGMPVKFTATFNDKGKVVAPVRNVTIFTPSKENPIGVYADTGLGGGANDLFSDVDTTQKQPEGKPFTVAGAVTSARGNKLKVAAGRTSIEVELADKAQISVEVSHLQFMQPGDNVSIEGWYNPALKRDVVANKLTVSAAGTLGETKKPK